ncbi:MAG: NADH-quinone oxidoreductase subunit N [candidate division Zixibacteria bacterium]|nr:NADH-quinone oxidoreductase subunit N [candidate division Zixibacteria bacterium]
MIDYTSAGIDFGLIAPEIALLVAAFVILLTSSIRGISGFSSLIALAGLATALVLSGQQWGHQASGFFGMISCDNFGIAFKIIFSATSILVILLGQRFLVVKGIDRPEFSALVLISTMGMMVMANTTDLVVMFIGLEIMSVPLYVLAGFARRSLRSNEASIKYFLMGAFASAFLLMGIAFIYGASGTTELRRLVADFSFIMSRHSTYVYAGAAMILVGFGFKVAAVPFHSWVPDVYEGAPTPVTAFFSVAPKAAGFAVMLRIFLFGLEELALMSDLFWILAVVTMTVGNVLALRQENIKRMLAYSSIAHAGYIMIVLAVGGPDAVSAAVFYLVAYASCNLGGFAVVTLLETRSGCRSKFSELPGLAAAHPYLAAMLALFMLGLAGFPPTVGFFGKFFLFSAAVKAGFIWLAVIGVMNSFISVYYYLRVVKAAYFEKPEDTFIPVSYSPAIIIVLIITSAATLGLGLFPQQLVEFTRAAFFAFL